MILPKTFRPVAALTLAVGLFLAARLRRQQAQC